jgi:hypothetical protein
MSSDALEPLFLITSPGIRDHLWGKQRGFLTFQIPCMHGEREKKMVGGTSPSAPHVLRPFHIICRHRVGL